MNIGFNIATINKHINNSKVKVVVVSKNQPIKLVKEVYDCGYRDFAENTVQNLILRKEHLPNDIKWHMIGHLQTNKVKFIAPFVYLIHSVDSLHLANVIDKEAKKNNRVINILLQINISNEKNKYGFSYENLDNILDKGELSNLNNIKILGLMGMASNSLDQSLINSQFAELNIYFKKLQTSYFKDNTDFKELSIGMSNDYLIAINNNATIIRLGSSIFNLN
ncbi:MAG: YggS family pyridoxal phosphate-dependent enzyme [Solitalea-like symbiont of Acarus siro]